MRLDDPGYMQVWAGLVFFVCFEFLAILHTVLLNLTPACLKNFVKNSRKIPIIFLIFFDQS
jgi:hypothetical protein